MNLPLNLESARNQMLGQQIRAWEVLDERVLDAFRSVPREDFVPKPFRDLAFADTEIPLAHRQEMMAPKLEGRLLQALAVDPIDEVLEVGTGSAYVTACLGRLAKSVVSLDIFAEFTDAARAKLSSHSIDNVTLETTDALETSYKRQFDAIAVTGSVPVLSNHFINMLRPGGRLFVVAGRAPIMEALLIRLQSDGSWTKESLFETFVPPLINAERAEPFVL